MTARVQSHFQCSCFLRVITTAFWCPRSLCQQSSIPKQGVALCSHTPIPRRCLTGSMQIWLLNVTLNTLEVDILKEQCRSQICIMKCVQFLAWHCNDFKKLVPGFHYKASSGQPSQVLTHSSLFPTMHWFSSASEKLTTLLKCPLTWQHTSAQLPPSSFT